MSLLHEEDVKGMLRQWAPHLMEREMLEGQDLLTAALAWTSTEKNAIACRGTRPHQFGGCCIGLARCNAQERLVPQRKI